MLKMTTIRPTHTTKQGNPRTRLLSKIQSVIRWGERPLEGGGEIAKSALKRFCTKWGQCQPK